MQALQQMTVLMLLMLTGLAVGKIGILKKDTVKSISGLVVDVANPAMIICSAVNAQGVTRAQLLAAFPAAAATFGVLIAASLFVPELLRIPPKDRGIYRSMTAFNNMGFMGLPIMRTLYGEDSLLYASVFLMAYNVLMYSYGVFVISGEKGNLKETLRRIANPGVIASLLAILIVVTGVKPPAVISDTLSYLGDVTAPLSMMCIGASMMGMNPAKMFFNAKRLLFCALKLLAFPVLILLIFTRFFSDPMLLGVILVTAGTPVGSMNAMLAQQYARSIEEANLSVAVSTILSVATIPVLHAFLNLLLAG